MAPRQRKLAVSAHAVPSLREGAWWEIAHACEALLAIVKDRRGARPKRYQPPLDRFDAARRLLDDLAWSTPPVDVQLDPERYSKVLAAALKSQLTHQREDNRVLDAILRDLAARTKQLAASDRSTSEPDAGSAARVRRQLTPRQAEIFSYLKRKEKYGAIAVELHISVETVRSHARSIRRVYGVKTSSELARIIE